MVEKNCFDIQETRNIKVTEKEEVDTNEREIKKLIGLK